MTTEWGTPPDVFADLESEFHFTLDVCAQPYNAKCDDYFTPEQNGLAQPWRGVCWCNPPYGRQIADWMRKAYIASQMGATVVMLVPARTDTAWWHDYAEKASERRFIRGRLYFTTPDGEQPDRATFPSVIVIFTPEEADNRRSKERSSDRAAVWGMELVRRAPRRRLYTSKG